MQKVIRCLLRNLATLRPSLSEGIAQVQLAAITPYKRQCRLITQALREWQSPEWIKLVDGGEAFTATAYQGREADVVILSMGRNNYRFEMGFLDRKQMNVALSRARRLLVIVGCFRMLEERAKSHEADDIFVATLVQELRPYVVPAHEAFPEVSR